MLSEEEGCAVLKRVFEERGFAISERFPFEEEGVAFNADGWDPAARVGYEYMSRSDGDHEDLDPDELAVLGGWMEEGRLFLFVIDETDIDDADELAAAARAFLDEVERRRARGGG